MFQDDFNQPTFADLRLVLRSSQGGSRTSNDLASESPIAKRRCTGVSLDDVRVFYTHKHVLASSSPVMKAMLLRAKELRDLQAMRDGLNIRLLPVECSGSVCLLATPPAGQLPDPQPEVLELPVEHEELSACEVLFRSIYSGNLAEEVNSALSSEQGAGVSRVKLLVQVYRLADRLEVCTDPYARAISALSSADCESIDDVNYVFSLKMSAPALAELVAIKALFEKCLSQLVARFGDITELFLDESLFEEFEDLDFLTALAFFDSDNLEVVSENEILTLMSRWIGEDWADQISKEQLVAFSNVLRLGDLTTSMITNLTVIAPWLPLDPVVLGHAAAWKSYQVANPAKAASMQNMLQASHGSSVAWFRDKREHYEGTITKTYGICEQTLANLLKSVHDPGAREDLHAIRSTRTTVNGYDIYLTLSVQHVTDGSRKTFVLSVGFEVRTSELISKSGSKILVHVNAGYLLGDDEFCHGTVCNFVDETHTLELTRVDTLDDFSCLGRYLDMDGGLLVQLRIGAIN